MNFHLKLESNFNFVASNFTIYMSSPWQDKFRGIIYSFMCLHTMCAITLKQNALYLLLWVTYKTIFLKHEGLLFWATCVTIILSEYWKPPYLYWFQQAIATYVSSHLPSVWKKTSINKQHFLKNSSPKAPLDNKS